MCSLDVCLRYIVRYALHHATCIASKTTKARIFTLVVTESFAVLSSKPLTNCLHLLHTKVVSTERASLSRVRWAKQK